VVAFGPGLHTLRDDTSPVKACIKSMSEAKPHLAFSALICVLNTKASAMEATLAKTVNDLFMVFSLSVLAQVYAAA
jgi:hypothetical protein